MDNQITSKPKKSGENELERIDSNDSDSGPGLSGEEENPRLHEFDKKDKRDSFNSNRISDDEDDKKTEKYTDRSYGNDDIIREIISKISKVKF